MKKFVFVILALLLCTGVAYAGDNVVGKYIQGTFPVVVNGKQLDTQAIAVDGVSYLPTRAVSNALGVNVDFQNNTIYVGTEPSTANNNQITSSNSSAINNPSSLNMELFVGKWQGTDENEKDTFIIDAVDANGQYPVLYTSSEGTKEGYLIPWTQYSNTITAGISLSGSPYFEYGITLPDVNTLNAEGSRVGSMSYHRIQ